MIEIELRQAIKTLRINKDMTVAYAAERCGISKSMLSMIENGTRTLDFDIARRLFRLYGYSLDTMVRMIINSAQETDKKRMAKHTNAHIMTPQYNVPLPMIISALTTRIHTGSSYSIDCVMVENEQSVIRLMINAKSEVDIAPIQPLAPTIAIVLYGSVLCEHTNQNGTISEEILKQHEIYSLLPQESYMVRNHRDEPCCMMLISSAGIL